MNDVIKKERNNNVVKKYYINSITHVNILVLNKEKSINSTKSNFRRGF